jgi:hypothetical protein
MKATRIAIVFLMMVPLIVGNLFCATGKEPETVIVPVGEPSGDDPYDSGGELGCGEESTESAITAAPGGESEDGAPMVLVTFRGTEEIWLFWVTVDEARSIREKVERIWASPEEIESEDVDFMQQDLCAPIDQRSDEGKVLYAALSGVLGDRMTEMETGVCQ